MLLLLGNLVDELIGAASKNPFPAVTACIAFLVLFWSIIKWIVKRYLASHPFAMTFSNEGPLYNGTFFFDKEKVIENIPNLGHESLWLRIKLKTERHFEQINIRLVEKKCSIFGGYKDASKTVSIKEIFDPLFMRSNPIQSAATSPRIDDSIPNKRIFSSEDDSKGGQNGCYNPPYFCPKDDFLWYEIKLNIDPNIDEWEGYIGFQHLRGDSRRAYAHNKITIKNTKKLVAD